MITLVNSLPSHSQPIELRTRLQEHAQKRQISKKETHRQSGSPVAFFLDPLRLCFVGLNLCNVIRLVRVVGFVMQQIELSHRWREIAESASSVVKVVQTNGAVMMLLMLERS